MIFVLCLSSFASADKVDDAISWMYDNGLTIHNNKIDFMANRWLRRDEAAKFYVNFSKLLGKTTYVKTTNQCVFSDINDSRFDLKDIVVESCRLWLFQGSKGKFSPKSQLTNAQAITVLVRLLAGNQSEVWLTHRANNYYTKANELGILQSVSMNSKDSIATRGNVWVIIYNGDNLQNNISTLQKTKPDLVLSSVVINNSRPAPKVGDSKIYANFTIKNIGKAISFSSTTKWIFSCTNNWIEIFKYEIKNWYIKENGEFDIAWIENSNSINIDLFPAPESDYRLNCSISLSSNEIFEYFTNNNNKNISFVVENVGVVDMKINSIFINTGRAGPKVWDDLIYFQVNLQNIWTSDFILSNNQNMALICNFTDRSQNTKLVSATNILWESKIVPAGQTVIIQTTSLRTNTATTKEWMNTARCELKWRTEGWIFQEIIFENLYNDGDIYNNSYNLNFNIM